MRAYSTALTIDLRGPRQLGQIARPVQLAQCRVLLEQHLERDRVGQHPVADPLRAGGVDAAVDRLVEVLGAQELRDPVIGLVVDQDGAEHRLLGLDIVRRDAEGGGGLVQAWPALDHG